MLTYSQTPLQEIENTASRAAGIRLVVKREDMNHQLVSGNKWWKLRDNLAEAKRLGKSTLLTFGGAYSNHIYATAGAAKQSGLHCIGVIRGEETTPLNATLTFAVASGMHLHYTSRVSYRRKNSEEFLDELRERFGDFYLIPEGGTNALAVQGVKSFAGQLNSETFDYLCCAVGTGGTLAGLISGLTDRTIIGFSSLKGEGNLEEDVVSYLPRQLSSNWLLNRDYHFGGYAKYTVELLDFIREIKTAHDIPLEQVYTGKMFYGVFDLMRKGFFKRGSTVMLLHTGGLQGALQTII